MINSKCHYKQIDVVILNFLIKELIISQIRMDGESYVVEEILEKRSNAKGKIEYLVKWLNYPLDQSTWEPVKHLQFVPHMIRSFEMKLKREEGLPKTHQIEKKRGRRPKQYKKSSIMSHSESLNSKSEEKIEYNVEESSSEKSMQKQSKNCSLNDALRANFVVPPQKPQKLQDQIHIRNIIDPSLVEDDNFEQNEDSLNFSDVQDTIEVLQIKKVDKIRYYQVKFAQQIKWISNEMMRKHYPHQLIAFYEKFVTLT